MRGIKRFFNKIKLPNGIVVFLLLAALLTGIGFAMDEPMTLINLPALLIVVTGTLLATILSFSFRELKLAYQRVKALEDVSESQMTSDANQILHFSQLWFRKLYHLIDRDIEALDNQFLKKGLQMVRDRQSGDDLLALMNWKLTQEKDRDARTIKVFQSMANYAPVFGLIGSLLGVMSFVQGIDSTAITTTGIESLSMGLVAAFVSTLYGLLLAHLMIKPLIVKLELSRAQYLKRMSMLAEGVVMIEQQRTPAEIRDILLDYIQSINSELDVDSDQTKLGNNKTRLARKPFLLKFGA